MMPQGFSKRARTGGGSPVRHDAPCTDTRAMQTSGKSALMRNLATGA